MFIRKGRPACARSGLVELAVTHSQQHLRVGPEVAELVHLVPPLPGFPEMCARGMGGIEHIRGEGLGPRVSVEAGADECLIWAAGVARLILPVTQYPQFASAMPERAHAVDGFLSAFSKQAEFVEAKLESDWQ